MSREKGLKTSRENILLKLKILKAAVFRIFDKRNGNPFTERHPLCMSTNPDQENPEYGIYGEAYFHELLRLERKRTERLKHPFLLALLSMNHFQSEGHETARKIIFALLSSTRETDMKGWYQNNAIIGIIFLGMTLEDRISLQQKIWHHLSLQLTGDEIKKIGISFHAFPGKSDGENSDDSIDLNLYPDLEKKSLSQKNSLLIKRGIDIIGSLAGLILFSPLFLLIPLLIKMTSRGPVLYKQERIGLRGKKFTFIKFRSMYVNNNPAIHREYVKNLIAAPHDTQSRTGQKGIYKLTNDPRITSMGRILRGTSLDELPQFVNVLMGDMSLVGPRPPIQYEVENYDLWHRCRVFETKPGITGLWQVHGRSSTTFDEMVRLDLKYIREWSIWLDIRILLKTPWVVLNRKGAY